MRTIVILAVLGACSGSDPTTSEETGTTPEATDRFGVADEDICPLNCARTFECREDPTESGFDNEADCVVGCEEDRSSVAASGREGCPEAHTTMLACSTLSCEDYDGVTLPDAAPAPSCPDALDDYLEACIF